MTRSKLPDDKVTTVARALERRFGAPTLGNKRNPFNELVYIVLSSKTPPRRYQDTYAAVRRAYRASDAFAAADPREVAKSIAFGGLHYKKALQLCEIAWRLKAKFRRVTLAPLRTMTDAEAEQFLIGLPGVGLKTARCVLLYALDRNVFPVDSHCFRVVRRLGWIEGDRTLTDSVANDIQNLIPPGLRKRLHVGMVLLGRTMCLPTNPGCQRCPLIDCCPTGHSRWAAEPGLGQQARRGVARAGHTRFEGPPSVGASTMVGEPV